MNKFRCIIFCKYFFIQDVVTVFRVSFCYLKYYTDAIKDVTLNRIEQAVDLYPIFVTFY